MVPVAPCAAAIDGLLVCVGRSLNREGWAKLAPRPGTIEYVRTRCVLVWKGEA